MKNSPIILAMLILSFPLWGTPEEDFIAALRDSRLQDARFFMESGHSVDTEIEDGSPALHIMCREQRSHEVRWLIGEGADPNSRDQQGLTPLMLAAEKGNRNIIQILLQGGGSLNLQTPLGFTALHLAVNNGQNDAARYLEERGGRIIEGYYDHPVLSEIWSRRQHYARALRLTETRWIHYEFLNTLINGDYRSLRIMLDTGTDPDAADTEGVTALMMSAASGNIYPGELLLARGADPGLTDSLDLSALWYAAYMNHMELINALLDTGLEDESLYLENSPLFGAFSSGSYDAMVRLVDAGWDLSIKGRLGASLAHYAAFQGDLRTLVEIKKAGVSLNVKDGDGLTPQDYLIKGYHLNEAESLYLPLAVFLKYEGIDATLESAVLDNVKLSRIIYSNW